MNILFAASEAVPFAKTGGLADVVGTLPKALRELGLSISVILPKYSTIAHTFRESMVTIAEFEVELGWRKQYCGVQKLLHEGTTYYFIDNEYYFKRDDLYGYADDGERYAFFSLAVIASLAHLEIQPDVIHCHDWQTGMIPLLLRTEEQVQLASPPIKTVFTIHNLKYQGVFAKSVLQDFFRLDSRFFTGHELELHGGASYLKGGLLYADHITTVSPTYAREIQTEHYGESLDSLLRYRSHQLTGIVNGIDVKEFDPMTDRFLSCNYRDSLVKKTKNKLDLQARFGLPVGADKPLIVCVGRLVQQKGLDLIQHVMPQLVAIEDAQWMILGTGEARYEYMFGHTAWLHPQKMVAQITFNDELAHQLYAAADLFLMPSLFEPCGIGQLIAMRYRAVPIVRETGGLCDTVQPYNQYTGEGTGFTFRHYNAHEMLDAIQRAVHVFKHDPQAWQQLHHNMRKCDFSWYRSARSYQELYHQLCIQE
jgi:starch synthase